MGRTLHIVATCTDLKRLAPHSSHRLRGYGTGSDRPERWLAALRNSSQPRVAAEDLYAGNHWVTCRDLPREAHAMGWSTVALWVASAGYGVLASDQPVVAYSATFTPGNPDSVMRGRLSPSIERRAWWAALTSRRRSLRSLAAEGAILFVGSNAYLDAAQHDLATAIASASRPASIVLVTSGRAVSGLEAQSVLAAGAMRTDLGGPMTSLNARLAHRIVGTLGARDWSVESARRIAAEVEASAPPIAPIQREAMTDAAVRAYVRRELRRDEALTASRLLRSFRDDGRACEQKRFGRLFREERESWLAAE